MNAEGKHPRVIKIVTLATIVGVVITVLISSLLIYWLNQPSDILEINNSPVPVQPPEVEDGNKVILSVDFCKKTNDEGVTTLNLIGHSGGAKIAVNWPSEKLDPTCSTQLPEDSRVACRPADIEKRCIAVPVPIPGQTPTDTYHAEFEVCYDLNPFKKPCTTFRSDDFRVVNKGLGNSDAMPRE